MERELFVLLKETLERLGEARHRPARARFADRDIVLVWIWAVIHDRPIDWACQRHNWPWHDRTRPLPSGATMSRRLRTQRVQRLMHLVLEALRLVGHEHPDLLLLDGKALPISGISADKDGRYGRGSGGMARGYKLHSITDSAGNHRVFDVRPMNVNEVRVAKALLERMPMSTGMRMLADGNYDCNKLYDLAAARGVEFIAAPRRKKARGRGHHRHSPHRLHAIRLRTKHPEVLAPRKLIEGQFGTLGNIVGGLSPLPNHVRGLARVSRWVLGKLIIDALHRLRRNRIRVA